MENKFASVMENASNLAYTENGALSYVVDSLNNPLVKSLYSISGYRAKTSQDAVKYFINALDNEHTRPYCAKYALFVRDFLNGCGERRLGRELIAICLDRQLLTVDHVVDFLTKQRGGRWDDIVMIYHAVVNEQIRDQLFNAIAAQLKIDMVDLVQGKPVSLLGKWLPSINCSNATRRRLGINLANRLHWSYKQYRKTVSALRARINIVEHHVTTRQYDSIDYSRVPALAMNRYIPQFNEYDYDRFSQYLSDVKANKTKINTTGVTAVDVVRKIIHGQFTNDQQTDGYQVMWDNRAKYEFTADIVPVCDVSGSMMSNITSSLNAIDVAIGLTIAIANANTGPFNGIAFEFSDNSHIINLKNKSIVDQVKTVFDSEWGFSTNVEAVLQQILDIAVKSQCERIPTIVFFSDMEFNQSVHHNSAISSLFDCWRDRYRAAGYDFPKVVFWNINNRTNTIPMRVNELGMIALSGFNDNLIKMVVSDRYDSWEALKDQLDNTRYSID